jgi:hypothetical protein
MIQLKDVLHLYLGCEVIGSYNDEPRKGYLTGLTNGGTECEIQFFEEDGLNVFEHPEFNTAEQVKPIFRRLSSMTKDEAQKVAALENVAALEIGDEDFIITYEGMGYSDFGKGYNHEIHESVKCFKVEIFSEHPMINGWLPAHLLQLDDEDCSLIWGSFKDAGKELIDDVLSSHFQIMPHLLKCGFDLFNLIESGQAVDASTIDESSVATKA